MRVAVIGGGPCGLGAVRMFRDEGLEAVCFEKTSDIGGLWSYRDDDIHGYASVMKSTIINTSKELGACSSLPPPAEFPNYMHNSLMLEYIKMMAVDGDCVRHVRLNHETVMIEKAEDYEKSGRWKVTNKNTKTEELVSEIFDFVAICIGHHVYPNMPEFPGQQNYKGKIIHSHSLKKVDGFEDLRVVVLGVGNSGMDAAVELSSVTKQVYLASRHGAWVIPRVGPKGHPFDAAMLRRINLFMQSILPYDWVCSATEKQINQWFNHDMYNMKPKHRIFGQHPTVSDSLPIKLLSGLVAVRGTINRFTEKGVVFEGEENETEVDAVVFATGYIFQFPFVSDGILKVNKNKIRLYKCIFPPELPHSTLAVLGLVQPNGPGIPVGEMQCRYAARVFSGHIKLPSRDAMEEDINEHLKYVNRFVDTSRHTIEVDFISYIDELAVEIGCKPNFWKMAITDPKLWWTLIMGPSLPYQYRLEGPHQWKGARNAILTYKDRLFTPLQKPGQKYRYIKKTSITILILKLLFLLPILWIIFNKLF